MRAADLILHAGDFVAASVLAELEALGPPVAAVHGNVDDRDLRAVLPERRARARAGGAAGGWRRGRATGMADAGNAGGSGAARPDAAPPAPPPGARGEFAGYHPSPKRGLRGCRGGHPRREEYALMSPPRV